MSPDGMKMWDELQNIIDRSASLSSQLVHIDELGKQVHDSAHELQDLAAQVAGGLIMAAIGPMIHWNCPTPSSTPIKEMCGAISAGGMILVNLSNAAKKQPPRWVRVDSIDQEKNSAMIREPFWSTTSRPLAKIKEACWEVVMISRYGG